MVFLSNIVQAPVIYIKLKASFFFANKTRAFTRELLARINPLSKNLFKVFYNTNNLLQVIPYKRPHGGFFLYPFSPFSHVNM